MDERAHVYGSMGEVEAAYFDGKETLVWPGTFGDARGTYQNRDLVVHGALGDVGPIHIGERGATVEGTIGSMEIEFNRRCSDRQAAMGVMSLVWRFPASRSDQRMSRLRETCATGVYAST